MYSALRIDGVLSDGKHFLETGIGTGVLTGQGASCAQITANFSRT